MTGVQLVAVTNDEADLRLDRWFRRHYPGLTHGRLEKLLRTGQIRLDGGRAKASTRVSAGQKIRVPPPIEAALQAQKRPAQADPNDVDDLKKLILHRDDHVIALNKPPGLAVQGGSGVSRHIDGMLDGLRFGASERPRLVHRLDKDTSGVLLLGRSASAAAHLASAFRGKAAIKTYWALTAGVPSPEAGRIDLAVAKRPTDVGERKVANLAQGLPIDDGLENAPALVGDVIRDESLWACRTCGACQTACPVFIEHVPTIVDMRRSLVMEEARMPESVQGTLETLERQGHPWRGTPYTRESWMEDMDVPTWTGDEEYLYFVGCTGAMVDRAMEISKSVVKLLREADVSFGVLGGNESCNGDPARRLGNEYLYQILAEQLISTFNEAGVKKIITHCPHCLNTFLNEYPDMGGNYEVLHHAQLLEKLIDDGKLRPKPGADPQTITFHDSCYLGRHNGLYDSPRRILEAIPTIKLVEMPRNREQGLCCGAGGGNMWMEEQGKERVNEVRVQEAIDTGADAACSACPFCIQMFDSGIDTVQMDREGEDRLKVFDVVELLEVSVAPSAQAPVSAAADSEGDSE